MKVFVQYLDYDLKGKLAPVCGDRGIVILDGRQNLQTWIADAEMFNGFRRPTYPAFDILRGDRNFTKTIYQSQGAFS